MTTGTRWARALALLLAAPALSAAQADRPRATVRPATPEVTVAPGASVALVLEVSLPAGVHVQAHKPRDPLLIPTVLSVDVPAEVSVDTVGYPFPEELAQAGRPEPLLVLGPRFEISARLSIAADAQDGVRTVPIVLRYQACNDTVCFPPARATAAWTLTVARTREAGR